MSSILTRLRFLKEKPQENWVTPAKVNAIRGEFMRQADKLDGLEDGVINNYMAALALFNMDQGDPKRVADLVGSVAKGEAP